MIQKIFNIREKTTAIPLKNLSNNLFHWLHIWNSSDKQTIWQKYRNNDGNNSLKNVKGEGEKIVGCLFFCILHDQKWKHILKRALVRAKGRKIIQTEVYAARIQNVECPSTGNIRAQSIRAEARATQMHTTNRRDGRTTKRISNWIRSFRLFRKFRRRPFNLLYFFYFYYFFSLSPLFFFHSSRRLINETVDCPAI